MTRELETNYMNMCARCKKTILESNKKLLIRLIKNHGLRATEKLTGIPKSTLSCMSDSVCFRTFRNELVATDNGDNLGVNVSDLSKRMKEIGQKKE